MGILQRLFGKPDPRDILRMPTTPDGFLATLRQRKFWRRIDATVLNGIAKNADGNIDLLRKFAIVSERYRIVETNFVPLATKYDSPAVVFALTLYRLGSDLCQHSSAVEDPGQSGVMLMYADMAFTGAVLCDPTLLAAYAGMAFLHGYLLRNKEVALEWCGKYKVAEQPVLDTADEQVRGEIEDLERSLMSS